MLFNRPMTSMEKTLLVIIVTYITIVAIRSPQFFSPGTFFDLFKTGAGFLILALGALIVFISGGIDVSSAAIAIVAGYSSANPYRHVGHSKRLPRKHGDSAGNEDLHEN
jgi:simple sugar transport system permease protein